MRKLFLHVVNGKDRGYFRKDRVLFTVKKNRERAVGDIEEVHVRLDEGVFPLDHDVLRITGSLQIEIVSTVFLTDGGGDRRILEAVITRLDIDLAVARDGLAVPRHSIGTQIFNTKLYLEIPDLFAWTAVVVTLSLILEKLLQLGLERRKGGWEG